MGVACFLRYTTLYCSAALFMNSDQVRTVLDTAACTYYWYEDGIHFTYRRGRVENKYLVGYSPKRRGSR